MRRLVRRHGRAAEMSALFVVVAALAAPLHTVPADCQKTFSKPMIERAIDSAYSGTRDVSDQDKAHLRKFIRCARTNVSRMRMKHYWKNSQKTWLIRRNPPMSSALVSWYGLGGAGACGVSVQDGYGFASLFLPCGAVVEMCHIGCVSAIMKDRGPYVFSRLFDLNANLKSAIGCSDLCIIKWRRE